MKKAFNLIPVYLINLILGLVIGTFFVGVYMTSLNFLAGHQTAFLVQSNFFPAFCIVSLAICFIMPIPLCTYKIRHQGHVMQALVFVFLQCFTWLIVFPFFNYRINRFMDDMSVELLNSDSIHIDENILSSGFFRENNGRVYYFLDDITVDVSTENKACGVIIETGDYGRMYQYNVTDPENLEVVKAASPYKDSLIKGVYKNSVFNNVSYITDFIQAGQTALAKGWLNYLVYLMAIVALSSVYMLAHISKWRAVNFISVLCGTLTILFFNMYCYSPFANDLYAMSLMHNRLFESMYSWCDNPFVFCSNILFTLIVVIIGIVQKISLRKEGKR